MRRKIYAKLLECKKLSCGEVALYAPALIESGKDGSSNRSLSA